jgi:hypothetical protein
MTTEQWWVLVRKVSQFWHARPLGAAGPETDRNPTLASMPGLADVPRRADPPLQGKGEYSESVRSLV